MTKVKDKEKLKEKFGHGLTQIKKFKNSGIEELKDKGLEARNKPPGAPLGAVSRPDSVGKQKKAQSMKKVFH